MSGTHSFICCASRGSVVVDGRLRSTPPGCIGDPMPTPLGGGMPVDTHKACHYHHTLVDQLSVWSVDLILGQDGL